MTIAGRLNPMLRLPYDLIGYGLVDWPEVDARENLIIQFAEQWKSSIYLR